MIPARVFLRRFLAHDPHRRALCDPKGVWHTYGDLRRRGEHTARWLAQLGVQRGDIVAIHLENGLDLVDAHLGCMAIGAVRLPLNAHYREAELAPILDDAAPALVLTTSPGRFPAASHTADLSKLTTSELMHPGEEPARGVWPEDEVTALMYTSGTTGRPKGVPQTWAMWETNLDALAALWGLSSPASPEPDCLWLALPLFHTHGLVLGLHGTLLRGARAMLQARFEPVVPPPEVTHIYGVPTWYRRWLPLMHTDPAPFRRLKLLVSGSDGLDAATSDGVFAATGHRILERYGMTETMMICSNPGVGERRAGTVGPPVAGVAVRLVDGEIEVSGPSVFAGYRGAAPRASEWFATGDAGEWDYAGYLRIVGRKKELVIVGGVNVSPAEVEAIFVGVPGTAEIGACGVADADLGEVVALAVVLAAGEDEGAVRGAIAGRAQALSGLKRPRRVLFLPALPRNALGKLQRGALRALIESLPP